MDCAAPASFTHTHTHTRGRTPLPPPREGIGARPKERGSLAFSHRATPLRPPMQLAERVQFFEKYAHLDQFGSSIWRRGSPVKSRLAGHRMSHSPLQWDKLFGG